jgi:hypothetical protein
MAPACTVVSQQQTGNVSPRRCGPGNDLFETVTEPRGRTDPLGVMVQLATAFDVKGARAKRYLNSSTRSRGRDKMCAHTRRREPGLPRSTSRQHLVRELSGHRTSDRSCTEEFPLSLADKNMRRAPDRARLQLRVAAAGTWPCFQAHARRGIELDRFQARRNRQVETSPPQRESCRRRQFRPGPDRSGKHSQSK